MEGEAIGWVGGASIATAIIALLALFRPEIEALLRRWFGRVAIYPIGETVEFGYSGAGATFGIEFVLRARGVEVFVREARIELTRLKDGARYTLDWGAFRPPGVVFGSWQNPILETPAGFLLEPKSPRRLNIALHDRNLRDEITDVITPLRQEWFEQLSQHQVPLDPQNPGRPVDFEQLYEAVSKSKDWMDAWTALQRKCYWSPGSYQARLVFVTAEPEKTVSQAFEFEVSQKDSDLLHANAAVMLRQNVGQQDWTLYFARVKFVNRIS